MLWLVSYSDLTFEVGHPDLTVEVDHPGIINEVGQPGLTAEVGHPDLTVEVVSILGKEFWTPPPPFIKTVNIFINFESF